MAAILEEVIDIQPHTLLDAKYAFDLVPLLLKNINNTDTLLVPELLGKSDNLGALDQTGTVLDLFATVRDQNFQRQYTELLRRNPSPSAIANFMRNHFDIFKGIRDHKLVNDALYKLTLALADPDKHSFNFIYETGGKHFTWLNIRLNNNNSLESIHFQNSLGNQIPAPLLTSLQTIYPKLTPLNDFDTCFTDHKERQQTQLEQSGGLNHCLDWVITNTMNSIDDDELSNQLYINRKDGVRKLQEEDYPYTFNNEQALNDNFAPIHTDFNGNQNINWPQEYKPGETIGQFTGKQTAKGLKEGKLDAASPKAQKYVATVLRRYESYQQELKNNPSLKDKNYEAAMALQLEEFEKVKTRPKPK